MTKEYCEEMIRELTGYYNMTNTSSTKRQEIIQQIAKYKEELVEIESR